nr:MAG TPA: hypothetical protein [Caudoviricetes sp.]
MLYFIVISRAFYIFSVFVMLYERMNIVQLDFMNINQSFFLGIKQKLMKSIQNAIIIC